MMQRATIYDECGGGREIIALIRRHHNGPVVVDHLPLRSRFVMMFDDGEPKGHVGDVFRLWLRSPR